MAYQQDFCGEYHMVRIPIRALARVAALTGLILLATGCAKVRGYQGYIADNVLIEGIQAGVDNRESVEKTLGRPSFVGEFDTSDWYYVSRQTRQYAYASPKPSEQTVLRVHFDGAGKVTTVTKTGVDQVVSIRPLKSKTPTLGKDSSFFQELFGNIGQVGSVGESGGTTDNPN
jgi:outer membrane protein assembly factor BamE (lipoprotein component of BamABCDE complex)